jgi:hypothetical protein
MKTTPKTSGSLATSSAWRKNGVTSCFQSLNQPAAPQGFRLNATSTLSPAHSARLSSRPAHGPLILSRSSCSSLSVAPGVLRTRAREYSTYWSAKWHLSLTATLLIDNNSCEVTSATATNAEAKQRKPLRRRPNNEPEESDSAPQPGKR